MSNGNSFDQIPYDKAKWHTEGEYPPDAPDENSYVFGGFFFGWVADHQIVDSDFETGARRELADFRRRDMTPGHLYRVLGGSLAQDMLNAEANAFAADYVRGQKYWQDFCATFRHYASPYYVEDSWENYQRICRLIEQAFKEREHRES